MATWRVWLPAIALSLVVLGVQCFAAVGAGYELFQGESSAKAQHVAEDFTVDPTLHWANPPGPIDSVGAPGAPYAGPVLPMS